MRDREQVITQLEARYNKLKLDYRDAERKADEADQELMSLSVSLQGVAAQLEKLRNGWEPV